MTNRSQKRLAVADLVSGESEISVTENYQPENLIADPSKSPRVQPENVEEMKTSLRNKCLIWKK